jgi:cytochrome c peroxidase
MKKHVMLMVIGSVCLASAVLAQPSLPDAAKGWTYVGNTQCKTCHNAKDAGEQWNVWKKTAHANAYQTLLSDKAKEIAAKKGLTVPPNEAPECLRCHVTGYDPQKKAAPDKIKMEDGVQCESCHGPSSAHIDVAKKLFTNKALIESVDIVHTHVIPDENTCRGCHNQDNPTYNPERYTLPDGSKADFDFAQAYEKIKHNWPEGYIEKKYEGKYPKRK